jgi:hypothetical protein
MHSFCPVIAEPRFRLQAGRLARLDDLLGLAAALTLGPPVEPLRPPVRVEEHFDFYLARETLALRLLALDARPVQRLAQVGGDRASRLRRHALVVGQQDRLPRHLTDPVGLTAKLGTLVERPQRRADRRFDALVVLGELPFKLGERRLGVRVCRLEQPTCGRRQLLFEQPKLAPRLPRPNGQRE